MIFGVSHDRADESPEAKARWFQSLPLSERMEIFCEFTELALALNPSLAEKKDAPAPSEGVRVLRLP